MFKIIVAGVRTFSDYDLLLQKCDKALELQGEVEVVSGRCSSGVLTFIADDGTKVFGADGLGERFAKEKGYPTKYFPADWDKHGKSAGYKRNEEMAKYADALIAFWDGKSKGTKLMIDLANLYGIKVKVVMF